MPGTVTVASKLPFPVKLQLQAKVTVPEQTYTGDVKSVEKHVKIDDKAVVINGCAVDRGQPSTKSLIGGFALTHNVDSDFWAEWVSQNKGFPPLQKGLIFAQEKAASTEGMAKDRHKVTSGFEPIDPENMPDEFRAKVTKAA